MNNHQNELWLITRINSSSEEYKCFSIHLSSYMQNLPGKCSYNLDFIKKKNSHKSWLRVSTKVKWTNILTIHTSWYRPWCIFSRLSTHYSNSPLQMDSSLEGKAYIYIYIWSLRLLSGKCIMLSWPQLPKRRSVMNPQQSQWRFNMKNDISSLSFFIVIVFH